MPFVMFLLYAAIMSIEPQQFEAAKIDGASRLAGVPASDAAGNPPGARQSRPRSAPSMHSPRPSTSSLPRPRGGPGQATMVFPLYIWRTAFISLRFGEASALAVIAIIISGIIGASLLAMNRRAHR